MFACTCHFLFPPKHGTDVILLLTWMAALEIFMKYDIYNLLTSCVH